MPPTDLSGPRGKPVTRRSALARRDEMTASERTAASAQIWQRAAALVTALPAGATLALYAAKGSEVETSGLDAIARARGRVVSPRVGERPERRLSFHLAEPAALVPGHFGLREPIADPATTVELAAIDLFFVPGLAFDRAGGRVGWGHGHYDATLSAAPRALRIGLAFECQLVDAVPRDPHDILLHAVITEAATYRAEV